MLGTLEAGRRPDGEHRIGPNVLGVWKKNPSPVKKERRTMPKAKDVTNLDKRLMQVLHMKHAKINLVPPNPSNLLRSRKDQEQAHFPR